jgi:hypothetical protein
MGCEQKSEQGASQVERTELPAWHRPEVSKISLEKTLFYINSVTDAGVSGETITS